MFTSVEEVWEKAKARPDVYFVGLQDLEHNQKGQTTTQAFFGGKGAKYADYGATACITPNPRTGGKLGPYDVGGDFTNAVYQVREEGSGAIDLKMEKFKRHVIPVPVFVGFMARSLLSRWSIICLKF